MAVTPPRGAERSTSSQNVARNFLALGSGEVVSRLISFFAYVYLARALGAESYGVIAFVGSVHLYLTKIAEFGIETVGPTYVARAPDDFRHLAGSLLGGRLAITAVTMAVAALITRWLLPEPERSILHLYLLSLVPIAAGARWIHVGLQQAAPVGMARVCGVVVLLSVVLVFVHRAADLWWVAVGVLASELCTTIVLHGLLWRQGRACRPNIDMALAKPVFRRAVPMVAQVLLGLLIFNSDVLFLRAMRDGETVGYYSAAYMLLSFLGNIGISYGMSLIPALSKKRPGSEGERALYHSSLAQVFAVSVPVAVGGSMVAVDMIGLWFGDGYGPAGGALVWLIWALPGTTFRISPWAGLVSRGREGRLVAVNLLAVAVNGGLNLTLIGPLGMVGAAVATIATETLTAVLMLVLAAQAGLPFLSVTRLLRPLLAAGVMAGVLLGCEDLPVVLRIAVGGLAYGAALAAMGVVTLRGGRPQLHL